MPKTISFHNGSVWSRGHNIRDERYTRNQEHIDRTLTAQNITIRDVPVRQAYDEIFGQAVEEYNAKQKRADRRIDNYYDKIKQDKRKHLVYECIVQIGDREDTGNTAEQEKQALIQYAEDWEKRNPNLRLVGAYIHCDEPDGTVHLHIDYIPVAECSRGMRLQNSLDRALQQQGFKSENIHQTAQIAWQEKEREVLTSICHELNIDAQHTQGIGKGREYLTPQEYRRAKQQQQEQIEEELQPLRDEMQQYIEMQAPIRAAQLEQKKILFSRRVVVNSEELSILINQAQTYIANKQAITTLKKDQQEVEQAQEQLASDRKTFEEERDAVLATIASEREKIEKAKILLSRDDYIIQLTRRIQYLEEELKILANRNHDLQINLDLSRMATSRTERTLKNDISEKNKSIKQLQETIEELETKINDVYSSVTSIIRAVGMLKYSDSKYKVSELSAEQGKLIDAITNYGKEWAEIDGFEDFVKAMDTIGISDGIQDHIDELTVKPKKKPANKNQ